MRKSPSQSQRWRRFSRLLVLSAAALAPAAAGDTITLTPNADNTIFLNNQADFLLLSNGAGTGIFCGHTAIHADVDQRGLVRFDLTSIPCGASITSVQFTLNLERAASPAGTTVELHRVLNAWGEGGSNSFGGGGEASQDGDANWYERSHPDVLWDNPGGDFVALASASIVDPGVPGPVVWSSTPGLIDDVSVWTDNPAANFGWLLLGNEELQGTARKYSSREADDPTVRPMLRIEYTPPMALAIDAQPVAAAQCPGSSATFTISASGTGPLSYSWQIQTPDGEWRTLGNDPGPLPCPSEGFGFAYATPLNSSAVTIGVSGCADVPAWPIRCVVSNACQSVTSDTAILTIGGPACCPADFNQDGVLNADDLGDFITGYFNDPTDPRSDFNDDGVINADDLGDFITAYFNGC